MPSKALWVLGLTSILQSATCNATQTSATSGFPFSIVSSPAASSTDSIDLKLSLHDYEWIGQRIYQNECASQPKYLTHWGKGEAFPSFGIGHFIWFPAQVEAPFDETFPALVNFLSKSHPPPVWLANLKRLDAPWKSKSEFDQAWSQSELEELRAWLLNSQSQQARFIVQQFQSRWQQAMSGFTPAQKLFYRSRLLSLMDSKQGTFAVIDYVNFKGMGSAKEQYQGEQWGLLSVLNAMAFSNEMDQAGLLEAFIASAKQRLQLRTQLAPPARNEQRWLKGWFKRLDGYR